MVATSGTGWVFIACFVAVIAAAALSVGPLLEGRISWRTVPAAGWLLWLVVAVPSLLQIPYPWLYDAFFRSTSAVIEDRQWWRVATALVVQDGGVAGTVSNLTLLGVALLGSIPLWGSRATAITFVLVGVALNVAAVALGAQDGAGDSGGHFATRGQPAAGGVGGRPPGSTTSRGRTSGHGRRRGCSHRCPGWTRVRRGCGGGARHRGYPLGRVRWSV